MKTTNFGFAAKCVCASADKSLSYMLEMHCRPSSMKRNRRAETICHIHLGEQRLRPPCALTPPPQAVHISLSMLMLLTLSMPDSNEKSQIRDHRTNCDRSSKCRSNGFPRTFYLLTFGWNTNMFALSSGCQTTQTRITALIIRHGGGSMSNKKSKGRPLCILCTRKKNLLKNHVHVFSKQT